MAEPVYEPSTRKRAHARKPPVIHTHQKTATVGETGQDGLGGNQRHRRNGFLNRVRMFDSCRGHYPETA